MVTDAPRPPPPTRSGILARTLVLCALIAAALILPFAAPPGIPPELVFVLALVIAIPSLIAVQRGWVRYMWARRIDRMKERAAAEPGNADLHYELGVLCTVHGDREGAQEAFERARAVDPRHAPAAIGLAHLRAETGDFDGALSLFEKAAELDPESFPAQYGIGGVYRRQEQFARAIHAYERALVIEPDDAYTLAEIARCYLLLGDAEQAAQFHARAASHGVRDRELEKMITESL